MTPLLQPHMPNLPPQQYFSQQEKLIIKIEKQLKHTAEVNMLFTIKWRVV